MFMMIAGLIMIFGLVLWIVLEQYWVKRHHRHTR